jgi:hypothetical protein
MDLAEPHVSGSLCPFHNCPMRAMPSLAGATVIAVHRWATALWTCLLAYPNPGLRHS